MKYPMFLQIFTIISAGITQVLLAVHPGGLETPSALRIELTGPMSRNREFQTVATATVDATYGKKMAQRKIPFPFNFWFNKIARPRDAHMEKNTVNTLKCKASIRMVKEIK